MAASAGFSTSITGQTIWSKRAANSPPITVTENKSLQFRQAETKIAPLPLYLKRVIKRIPKRPCAGQPSDSGKSFPDPLRESPLFPTYQMEQFYDAINKKEFKKLAGFLEDNCVFEDLTFPKPFKGKTEVLCYLEKLTACMGQQDMQFEVDHIWEGAGSVAAVSWHLEWNENQVPFTKGCSHYKLDMDDEDNKLIITRALVIAEPPIKLEAVAPMTFGFATMLFDKFPNAADRFLLSPEDIPQLALWWYYAASIHSSALRA